jgi:signal transduction histidine kinase
LFFHPEPTDPATVLRDTSRLQHEISSGAQIMEYYETTPLMMHGDPKLLFQVFSNLLSNAIKYSPGDARAAPRSVPSRDTAGQRRLNEFQQRRVAAISCCREKRRGSARFAALRS